MRTALFVAMMLSAGAAQADWAREIYSDQLIATVSLGGGQISWSEASGAGGPLNAVAADIFQVPVALEQGLNASVAQGAAANGVTFLGGRLSGNLSANLAPNANGTVFMTVGGLSYSARNNYSGRRLGIISFSCTNTASLNNISITAQFGAVDGALSDQVGITGNAASSTDCDSNLSWILPFFGDKIINVVENQLDAKVASGIRGSVAKVKDALFFARDQNWLVGLNKLVPAGKTIQLPDGTVFPIGQYVIDHLAGLVSNSQMSMQLGKGVVFGTGVGDNLPTTDVYNGDVINLTISGPDLTFTVALRQEIKVNWYWDGECATAHGSTTCVEP